METRVKRRSIVAARTLVAALLVSTPVGRAAEGVPERDSYLAVLYPQGPPVREDPSTGKSEPAAFEVHAAVELPQANALALIYSERVGARSGDAAYRVYLGLLMRHDGGLRKGAVEELTQFLPVSLEFPGNCLNVDAALDALDLAGRPALHVNLWAVLSGSGSISGASDVFFGLGEGGRLERFLILEGSSRFSRSGLDHSEFKDARLTLATARDGSQWLLVRTRSVSRARGRPPREQVSVASHEFVEHAFEPRLLAADVLSALEASGRALSRSRNLAVEPQEN